MAINIAHLAIKPYNRFRNLTSMSTQTTMKYRKQFLLTSLFPRFVFFSKLTNDLLDYKT